MGIKSKIAIVAGLALLIFGAVGAWAYDDSTKDEIARGVTIAGVDVSGMTRAEAKTALHDKILAPQRKPVKVKFEKQVFELPPGKLKIRADLDGALDQAFEESRSGALPVRVFRQISGSEVNASIPAQVTYSKPAVSRFVKQVAEGVYQEPVDASVSPTADSLLVVKAKDGHKLRDNLLAGQLTELLDAGRGGRTVKAKVNTVKPEVSTKEVSQKYPTYITVSRSGFTLKLWKNLKLAKEYPIAVGQVGLDTPAGLYTLQNKQVDPAWHVPNSDWAGDMAGQVVPGGTPENPLKARWMGIYDGAGIHGTSDVGSLGSAASHGCIRMDVPDVINLYDQVDVGTPIFID